MKLYSVGLKFCVGLTDLGDRSLSTPPHGHRPSTRGSVTFGESVTVFGGGDLEVFPENPEDESAMHDEISDLGDV